MVNWVVVLLGLSLISCSSANVVQDMVKQAEGTVQSLGFIGMIPVQYVYSFLGLKSRDQLDLPPNGQFHELKVSSVANDGSDLITIVKSPASTLTMTRSLNSDSLTIGSPHSEFRSAVKNIIGVLSDLNLSGKFNSGIIFENNPHNSPMALPHVEPTLNLKFWSEGQVGHTGKNGGSPDIPFGADNSWLADGHAGGPFAEHPAQQFDDTSDAPFSGKPLIPFGGHPDKQFHDTIDSLSGGKSSGAIGEHPDKKYNNTSDGMTRK